MNNYQNPVRWVTRYAPIIKTDTPYPLVGNELPTLRGDKPYKPKRRVINYPASRSYDEHY